MASSWHQIREFGDIHFRHGTTPIEQTSYDSSKEGGSSLTK